MFTINEFNNSFKSTVISKPYIFTSIMFSVIVYLVLSYFKIPAMFSIPISAIIFLVTFALSRYYYVTESYLVISKKNTRNMSISIYDILFIMCYILSIISVFGSVINTTIYIKWTDLSFEPVIRLSFAVIISIFAPGYVISSFIVRYDLGIIPRILSSYLISFFITGSVGYLAALSDQTESLSSYLVCVNSVLLIAFVIYKARMLQRNRVNNFTIKSDSKTNKSKSVLFAGLFCLVILSTYVIYGGKIIGDTWYYHGRALTILMGNFKKVAQSGLETDKYPPFSMAFLAAFFAISNVPSVNAYASLGFLNFVPAIAFYYMFTKWVPVRYNKAAPIALVLFMLGSGFGWIYALNLGIMSEPSNEVSSLTTLFNAGRQTIDIYAPNTFIDVGHPDITTALIIISLPCGFFLLGLVNETRIKSKARYYLLILLLVALGLFSHDEFGLFIVMTFITPILFNLRNKNPVYFATMIAVGLVIILGNVLPGQGQYYFGRGLSGLPFIWLYLIFGIGTWITYHFKIFELLLKYISKLILKIINRAPSFVSQPTQFGIPIFVVCVIGYLYGLSFVVWYYELPNFQPYIDTLGLRHIPVYFFPLRLGVSGLLGIAFILSYLFRRFEKEIFFFGVFALVSYLIIPQYLDFRAHRYVMVSMDAFAALLLYKIVAFARGKGRKSAILTSSLIGLVIISAALSTFMYIGATSLGLRNPNNSLFDVILRRDFPDKDTLQLLDFLKSNTNIQNNDGIAYAHESRWAGLLPKLESFTGIPSQKLLQSSFTMEESNLPGLYKLLNHTNTKFIVVDKNYISHLASPMKFVLNNFQKKLENKRYIVLSVTKANPSDPKAELALLNFDLNSHLNHVIEIDSSWPSANRLENTLPDNRQLNYYYNNKSFVMKPTSHLLFDIPSNDTNYIESSFRVLYRNITTHDTHAGIIWSDGTRKFAAVVRQNSLTVSFTGNHTKSIMIPLEPIAPDKWITIKVLYVNGMINVLLNNVLRTQIPQILNDSKITGVGLESWNTRSEFFRPFIGKVQLEDSPTRFGKFSTYDYYYILSGLAISKTPYDTIDEGDYSWASKKHVILTSDAPEIGVYKDYLSKGGTITLFSNDIKYGAFSKLLCIEPLDQEKFDQIVLQSGERLSITGKTSKLKISCGDAVVKSYYSLNGKNIAPYVIQKLVGNGVINFVNNRGYLSSVLARPELHFSTIHLLSDVVSSEREPDIQIARKSAIDVKPLPYFFGNISMAGDITIKSSSVMFQNKVRPGKFIVLDNNPKNTSSSIIGDGALGMGIYGKYQLQLHTNKIIFKPSIWNFGYAGFMLPKGSNLTISLDNNSISRIHLFDKENRDYDIAHSRVDIENIKTPISVLIRYPTLNVNGNNTIENIRSYYPYGYNIPWVDQDKLTLIGNSTIQLDHVNYYLTRTGAIVYTTYFNWVSINGSKAHIENKLDILARHKVIQMNQIVLSSYYGTRILVPTIILGLLSFYIVYTSPRLRKWLSNSRSGANASNREFIGTKK